ncbi:hypothetical protein AM493_17505 [Flavobacterium akiainvivens]|uniref:Outer membrane protein beta-barrel domain-containing protein n=1 Tax=Flavobacterium akiainvivens TaxID=1202724 RepID=A0A0M8MKW7_9FLAO|nr:hypothetical protein [Flavobacterium akiainvivens]KOS07638.1 hypothetical protein AM493_17505 [Flavobacterium akiainvivens]SFQ23235.1 hypothetical protein SAMN05444144_10281 [Flavobacterium akiainvivens]
MKKITLLLLALFAGKAFAQETETTTTRTKTEIEWYFGFGAAFHPDYNINSNLAAGGVKELPGVTPASVIGWNATFENNLSLTFEFGTTYTFNNRKKDGSQLLQVPVKLRLQYILAENNKLQFAAGGDVTFIASNLSVFSDATEIDMDDLNPETNTGFIPLRNQSWFVGPSASLAFKDKNNRRSFVLNAGYDFCFTNSKWKSDFANIVNPVRENGGRFYVNLFIPIN